MKEVPIATETELKLSARPDDLPALQRALQGMSGEVAPSVELVATYYDTPDLALRRAGVTLRVRRQGDQLVQTVKTAGRGALERGEWEEPIARPRPELDAPASGRRLPRGLDPDDLRPVFTTVVTRTVIRLEPRAGTIIEAALDTGEIRAARGAGVEPISEVELELKRGDRAALYDVALRLLDVATLHLETRPKSERGYVLAGAPAVPPARAGAVKLEPAMTVEAAFQAIGRSCIGQLLANVAPALTGDAEGIHQMRVALRRLRSAIAMLKPMLPPEHHGWAADEVRRLGDVLGPARDWHVFGANLLEPMRRALPGETALEPLAEAALRKAREAHEAATASIRSASYTAALLRLCRWFETRGWRDQPLSESAARLLEPLGEIAPALLARRLSVVRKRSRHFAELDATRRHKLRIALKKLRYTTEFLRPLYGAKKVRRLVDRLKPLQEDLGQLNDVRTARALLERLGDETADEASDAALERAGGLVLGWHERGLAEREKTLRRHVRRLRRARRFWPSAARA